MPFMALAAMLAANTAHSQIAASSSADKESDKKTFYEMNADGAVQIAPDGHVSEYKLGGNLQPAVAALVKRAVMGWHFEPIVVDGKPVVAKTAMHLELRAEPVAGKDEFSMHVASITFGNPVRHGIGKAPRYPRAAAGARLGAYVVLSGRLDESGEVAEVYPYQTSLDARASSEKQAEKWRREFETAAINAAKTWQYDLTEIVDGHATGAYVVIPVKFFMSPSRVARDNDWRGYEAGPIHPAPWATSRDQPLVAQSGDGATSTSSRFHLKDDVIGKAL
jgi:hypothetical protein